MNLHKRTGVVVYGPLGTPIGKLTVQSVAKMHKIPVEEIIEALKNSPTESHSLPNNGYIKVER